MAILLLLPPTLLLVLLTLLFLTFAHPATALELGPGPYGDASQCRAIERGPTLEGKVVRASLSELRFTGLEILTSSPDTVCAAGFGVGDQANRFLPHNKAGMSWEGVPSMTTRGLTTEVFDLSDVSTAVLCGESPHDLVAGRAPIDVQNLGTYQDFPYFGQ